MEKPWTDVIKAVAPWLGTALGGPLGGVAVTAIADVFGLSEKTEETVKRAIAGATPESILALKKADHDFAAQMQIAGYKNVEAIAALSVENTKDARAMQANTKSNIPGILAIGVTVGFFGILTAMMSGVEVKDNSALLIMLGALGTSWGAIVNFYFGSSHSSQNKDATIERLKM